MIPRRGLGDDRNKECVHHGTNALDTPASILTELAEALRPETAPMHFLAASTSLVSAIIDPPIPAPESFAPIAPEDSARSLKDSSFG